VWRNANRRAGDAVETDAATTESRRRRWHHRDAKY
jgi:hypothetical protein